MLRVSVFSFILSFVVSMAWILQQDMLLIADLQWFAAASPGW
jgi:hypothetical protein